MCKIRKGFSLIELMFVVAIIVLLVAVVIPMYNDYTERTKQASFCATVYNIEVMLYRWRAEHFTDKYPTLDELNTLLTNGDYFTSKPINPYVNKPLVITATLTDEKGSISYITDTTDYILESNPPCGK
jgi:prepilin-type N-terminal cleavage/methylation domain-containing protein